MHTPLRRIHSPLLLVAIATVPLLLAAISVYMVRDALSLQSEAHVDATAALHTSSR